MELDPTRFSSHRSPAAHSASSLPPQFSLRQPWQHCTNGRVCPCRKRPKPSRNLCSASPSTNRNQKTKLEMASFCRSVIMAGSRSLSVRSKALSLKNLTPKSISIPFSSPSTRALPCASRILSVLGGVESMIPLHSAIASARLQSSIAVDSSCWSWLSQDFAVPR
ncbi:uncharacterized protein LOC120171629 isoform X2 [Hibiscus syriacus]|uniref:uncharacterized protein LOC120171629 isoform X2 n=1 Tax=Hibiscus syriacus TaxID=106335 RepID=UPI00192403C5|nr:uncharacterized protein LOC120171629 isoform X2 [Hibiscus syriacus]